MSSIADGTRDKRRGGHLERTADEPRDAVFFFPPFLAFLFGLFVILRCDVHGVEC